MTADEALGPDAHSHDPDLAERRDAARTLEELLACAEALERGGGTPPDAEEWFRAESESLLQWAKHAGRFLSQAEFGGLIEGFRFLDGGLEHQVFYKRKNGRVLKVTKPPHFGHTWYLKDYVQNALWCNALFGDDIRLEGVVETSDGLSLVMSQPFVIGRSPTEEQIQEWFTLQRCVRIGPHKWKFPGGSIVSDAHKGNLILTHTGDLLPIDVHVERWSSSDLKL